MPPSLRRSCPRSLAPASGRQDHTTSPSASSAFVSRTISVHRIPRSTSVTIAKRPSVGRDNSLLFLFLPSRQVKFLKFRNERGLNFRGGEANIFSAREWTGRIALIWKENSAFDDSANHRFFHPPRCPGAPPVERGAGPNSGPDWRESVGWKILLPVPLAMSLGFVELEFHGVSVAERA